MSKYMYIGDHQVPFEYYETSKEMYKNALRNVLKIYFPNTVLPGDVEGYLVDSKLDSVTFVDDRTDHASSSYVTNTAYVGYSIVLGYALENHLVSSGDPQKVEGETYIEYTTLTLAQLTRQEKKLIDMGIDPWADDEEKVEAGE